MKRIRFISIILCLSILMSLVPISSVTFALDTGMTTSVEDNPDSHDSKVVHEAIPEPETKVVHEAMPEPETYALDAYDERTPVESESENATSSYDLMPVNDTELIELGIDPDAMDNRLMGDYDNNDKITAAEARIALRVSAKLEPGLSVEQLFILDANHDGLVLAADARLILRMSARLEKLIRIEVLKTAEDKGNNTGPSVLDFSCDTKSILLNEKKTVIFKATLSEQVINSLDVYNGNEYICSLNDDGTESDDIAGDLIYSGNATLSSNTSELKRFSINGKIKDDTYLFINFHTEIDDAAIDEFDKTISLISSSDLDDFSAIKKYTADNNQFIVTENESAISVRHISGLTCVYSKESHFNTHPDEPINAQKTGTETGNTHNKLNARLSSKANNTQVFKNEILVLEPFESELHYDFSTAVNKIHNTLSNYSIADVFKNQEVTVDLFSKIDDYKIIVIDSHGWFINDAIYGFLTGQKYVPGHPNIDYIKTHKDAIENGELYWGHIADGEPYYYAIQEPYFINNFNRSSFDNSLFYLGTCHGADSSSFADVLKSKGVDAIVAFKGAVFGNYNFGIYNAFFEQMLKNNATTTIESAIKTAKNKNIFLKPNLSSDNEVHNEVHVFGNQGFTLFTSGRSEYKVYKGTYTGYFCEEKTKSVINDVTMKCISYTGKHTGYKSLSELDHQTSNGYVYQELYAGKYEYEISATGYKTKTIKVFVDELSTNDLGSIILTPQATDGSVYGFVVDSTTNNPLKEVDVKLTNNTSKKDYNAKTDGTGAFSCTVPYGSYTVEFNKDGYEYCGISLVVDAESVDLKDHVELDPTPNSSGDFLFGNGTEENPYQVATPEQLDAVRNDLSAHYIQTADIDMSGFNNWIPIGSGNPLYKITMNSPKTQESLFTGSFDGNNHEISNLNIISINPDPYYDCYGLFGKTKSATLKNIRVDTTITINRSVIDYKAIWDEYGWTISVCAGGIVGCSIDSTISNCTVNGSIDVSHCYYAYIGGICGTGNPEGCVNNCSINVLADSAGRYEFGSNVFCGGITGRSNSTKGEIKKCKNTGDISAAANNFIHLGGISGRNGSIYDCVNTGNLRGITMDSHGVSGGEGNTSVGGIISYSIGLIERCVNYGNIYASSTCYQHGVNKYLDVGGIGGVASDVNNCYNKNNVISATTSVVDQIKDNYSVSSKWARIRCVSDDSNINYSSDETKIILDGIDVGIAGRRSFDEIKPASGGGITLSTDAFLKQQTYKDFDFDNVWYINPRLGGADLKQFAEFNSSEYEDLKGDGTEENPYQVATPEQLYAVRNDLSAHYIQTADIDLSAYKNWQPIGAWDESVKAIIWGHKEEKTPPFSGSFDGNGFEIKDLTINDTLTTRCTEFWGLFGCCYKASIKNVNLRNCQISLDRSSLDYKKVFEEIKGGAVLYLGSTIGAAYDTSIYNCHASGTIKVLSCHDCFIGGICGEGNATQCLNNCAVYVLADRDSSDPMDSHVHCGGITGQTQSVNGIIKKCKNTGNISAYGGNFVYCGGISGEHGQIYDCVNTGDVDGKALHAYGYSSFAGNANVGGIVGATSSDITTRCVNYGAISSFANDTSSAYAGGIAGFCGYYGHSLIQNCTDYSKSISAYQKDKDGKTVPANADRIAGRAVKDDVKNCYAVNDIQLISGVKSENFATLISPNMLMDQASYSTFDFVNVWFINPKLGGADLQQFAQINSYGWGDLNGDGNADFTDMLIINKYRLGKKELTEDLILLGDVNLDGNLDIYDMLLINKHRLGKLKKFPTEENSVFAFHAPSKLNYTQGEELDLNDMWLTVTNKNDSSVKYTIKTELQVSGYDQNKTGKQKVTARFNWLTYDFNVIVTAKKQ